MILTQIEAIAYLVTGNVTESGALAVLTKRVRPVDYGEIPPRYNLEDVEAAGKSYNVPPYKALTAAELAASTECRTGRTPRETIKPATPPPIAGVADIEREPKLDAERVTLEFGTKSQRRLDSGRQPITDAPLFGGPAQQNLFGDNK